MIADLQSTGWLLGQVEIRQYLGHVLGDGGYTGGIRSQRIVAEHVAVILDRGAAAGGVDDDGVEPRAAGR